MTYSASVGGPIAPLRAEAASLLQLLRRVRERFPDHADLLVFIDCLVPLDIFLKWGRSDFQPQPRDVVHFDILVPLLTELRSWPGTALLVKVKSHAGCLQNERADTLADLGTAWQCLKRNQYSQARPNTALFGYVCARLGGIKLDQSNFLTFSLETARQTRVS
jgi:hypothetical protein